MTAPTTDPIIAIAEAMASLCAEIGFAFVEDEHVAALGLVLRDFLVRSEIQTHDERAVAYYRATPRRP